MTPVRTSAKAASPKHHITRKDSGAGFGGVTVKKEPGYVEFTVKPKKSEHHRKASIPSGKKLAVFAIVDKDT